MNKRGSLDTVLSELLDEAQIWANEEYVNMGRSKDKTDTVIDVCLEQIARAISTHVTDILIKRLGLEKECSQTQGEKRQEHPLELPLRRKSSKEELATTQSLPCTAQLMTQNLTKYSAARNSRRSENQEISAPRYAKPLNRTCDRLHDYTLFRYHGENRLNRTDPPQDSQETPLENRASRLRKANAGRKLAIRCERSSLGNFY